MLSTYQSRLYELQSFTATPGVQQSLQFDLRGLPRGQRVAAFLLACDFNVNTQQSNLQTTSYTVLSKLLAQFDHESTFYKVRSTGAGLWTMFHHMNGRTLQQEQVTLSAGGNPNYFRAVAVLPVADANAFSPNDTAIPTELINGTTLQLVTGAASLSSLFSGQQNPSVNGSIVYRLFAALIEGSGPVDPTPSVVDYEDWGGQTILLKPGTYSHMAVYSDPLGPGYQQNSPYINLDTDLTRITWNIAGTPVLQNVLSWAQVVEFNRASVAGGFVNNFAEQLTTSDQPGNSSSGVPFVPIYTPAAKYKLTGLPHTSQPDSIVQLTGSATQFRVIYRRFPEKNESMVRAAGKAFGLDAFERGLKTATKQDVAGGSNSPMDIARRSRISKLIPGRLLTLKGGPR